MDPLFACTIVSKNYLPYARVLARSFLDQQPEGRFFVLLVDRNDEHIDPAAEPFELVEAEDLAEVVPEITSFLFKYTLLEANTAIKPFFLAWLFERHELPNLTYFDPDILITGSLAGLAGVLDDAAVVLTPHLDQPIDDGAHPGELAILQAGTYNLGFVSLRGGEISRRLLSWWQDRLYDDCVVRIDRGLFVDQKWMDLVPGLFGTGGKVRIETHPGWNVAYWNLHGRTVTREGASEEIGRYRSNGEPLTFFHFSGIQPDSLEHVSKHQDRFRLADLGAAADLYRVYAERVLTAGYATCQPWPYAFARFDNGVRIPDAARALYLGLSPAHRRRFGDPFAAAGDESFFNWLNQPASGKRSPHLSRLLAHVHRQRPDLGARFPDPAGKDFPNFSSWLRDTGRHELKLDPAFLDDLFRESRATLLTPSGLGRRLRNRLQRLSQSSVGRSLKQRLKGALGAERTRQLKRQLGRDPADPTQAPPPPIVERRLAMPRQLEAPGINLVGYLSAETGMGEAARGLARLLETAGVPLSLHNLELNVLARKGESGYDDAVSDFPYAVNLLVVNADQVEAVYQHLGAEVFAGRANVGYWLWELESFPDRWRRAFDVLHEVWTPSTFCLDAFSAVAPIPVRRLPLPVPVGAQPSIDRAHFELESGTFVVLYLFNFLSYMERKNPKAAVRAFRRAFGAADDALLLLKTSQAEFAPEARAELEAEIGDAKVRLVDAYYDRDEIEALVAACDAYLSPHRSEGYGLTVAEAMAHGKPVVATAYSGVTDFYDAQVGLPVDYRRVELTADEGPYPKGAVWADPDEEQIANHLRRLYDDPGLRERLGNAARQRIATTLDDATLADTARQRFETLIRRIARETVGAPALT